MATLQLYFLGPLKICSDGRQLSNPPTLKSQSLLAYLVLHCSQPQPRDRLAGLFFGERPDRKARRCLSTALWHIRRCLPDESVLLNDLHTVQFDPDCNLWLDLEDFETLASRNDIANLQSAVSLYRGDLLDGFYDDWIINERYRLESLYLDALARLMILYEAGRDYQAALTTSLRLLSRDALREDAHRMAMRAYCHLGQRKAALEQYARCREIILQELDSQPMIETIDLYQAIHEGRFAVDLLSKTFRMAALPVEWVGRSPLDVAAPIHLVGREQELDFLEDCWRKVQSGCSGLALISGEAGVGKTRLVEEFSNRLRWQGIRIVWGRCYEFERTLPYQPFADALRASLPTLPHDEMNNIPAWALREVARLLPDLLQIHSRKEIHPEIHHKALIQDGSKLSTARGLETEQSRLFDGATSVLAGLSSHGGLVLVLEDLHWASESTLQLLHHLARHLGNNPILIVGTFRPEVTGWQHPLLTLNRQLAREGLSRHLGLTRLSRSSVETIIQQMSGAGDSVKPLAEVLYRETEGNPFFLIESIKTLFETNLIRMNEGNWEGDFDRLSEIPIPLSTSLSETVLARIHRLEQNAQDAAGLAAVFGREFNFEPFNHAWGKGEEESLEVLEQLLRHRLVEEKFDPHGCDFTFTHHKIQEVVYLSLPRHRCLHLHAKAGAALEATYADELETKAGELAHHFELAALLDKTLSGKAIHFLLQAGNQAARQFAYEEAITYYRLGLDILHSQSETKQRMQQEVELQIALAVPITAIKGYAYPEVKYIYDRARDLCQILGDAPDLFTSMVGLTRFYGVSGNPHTGVKLAEQLLSIAQAAQETDLLVEAYRQRGGVMFSMAKLNEARNMWEAALALYDPAQHEHLANRFGHDPAVTCLGYLGMTLWILGYPDQAREQQQKLSNLISSMTHPASLAYAYCHLAKQACACGDARTTCDHAESAIYICQQQGLASWKVLATAFKGWALCDQGQISEGWALLEEGVQVWRARGLAHWSPFLLSLEVKAALKMRLLQEGTNALTAALEIGKQTSDQYWLAEIHRLGGELAQAGSAGCGSAEEHFLQAVETARQQEARMLELRAAVSLARFWQDQGRSQAARQALEGIYYWFIEGLDTRDLKAAGDLLQEIR